MTVRFSRLFVGAALTALLATTLVLLPPAAVPNASAAACPATVTTHAHLVDCIAEYNAAAAGTTTTINVGASILLSSTLPPIDNATSAQLQFEGGGYTLDLGCLGGFLEAVLQQNDGNSTISRVTLTGATAGPGLTAAGGVVTLIEST